MALTFEEKAAKLREQFGDKPGLESFIAQKQAEENQLQQLQQLGGLGDAGVAGVLGMDPAQQAAPTPEARSVVAREKITQLGTGGERTDIADYTSALQEMRRLLSGLEGMENVGVATGPVGKLIRGAGTQQEQQLREDIAAFTDRVRKDIFGSAFTETEKKVAALPGAGKQENRNRKILRAMIKTKESQLRNRLKGAQLTDDEINSYFQTEIGGEGAAVTAPGTGEVVDLTPKGVTPQRGVNVVSKALEFLLPNIARFGQRAGRGQLPEQALPQTTGEKLTEGALGPLGLLASGRGDIFKSRIGPATEAATMAALPATRGVKEGVRLGATAGGLLGGTGAVSEGKQFGEVAKQTAMGAGIGAAGGAFLGAIQNLMGAAAGVGTELQKGVLRPKTKVSPTFRLEEQELLNAAKKFGLRGSAKRQSDQLAQKYLQSSDRLSRVVAESTEVFDGDKLVDSATKGAKRRLNIEKGVGKENLDFWADKVAGGKSAEELAAVKFELLSELGNAWKKIDSGRPLTKAERVAMEFHTVVDSAIKRKVPAAGDILSDMSSIHKLAPGLMKAAKDRVGIQAIRGAGLTVSAAPFQSISSLLGRAAEKASPVSERAIPALQRLLLMQAGRQ